jgi:hypothetical protein
MLIDIEPTSHAVRVDQDGFDSLRAGTDPDAALAVSAARLGPALAVIDDPVVTLTLTVTGAHTRLEHRGWVGRDTATLLVALRPELFQLVTMPPAFLTSALVRLTRMRPRRPDDAGPDFGWELAADWAGGSRRLVASDGRDGLRLVDPVDGTPRPVSNTAAYRILSTLLPTDAELTG